MDGTQIKEAKPIELDNLLMYWKQYAHQLQQQDKNNLFSILIKRNPKIMNDNNVSVDTMSTTMSVIKCLYNVDNNVSSQLCSCSVDNNFS
jgi:hypothetical protein